MIKLTYCLRRLPHLTREQFQDYWLNTHGPLVRGHAKVLNIRRYVQTHTRDDPVNAAMRERRGSPAPYDGIAELWFDSVDAMLAPGANADGKAALRAVREDEANFLDRANSPLSISDEHILVGA